MAITIRVKRNGARLEPASHIDHDAMIEQVPEGVEVVATIKRDRSLPQHRLYWSVLQFVSRNLPEPPPDTGMARWPFENDPERLHLEAKWHCGVIKRTTMMDGESVFMVDSTSFSRMDQLAFARYFDCAMHWLSAAFFNGEDVLSLMEKAGYQWDGAHFKISAKVASMRVQVVLRRMRSGQWRIDDIRPMTREARGIDWSGIKGEAFDAIVDAHDAINERLWFMIEVDDEAGS